MKTSVEQGSSKHWSDEGIEAEGTEYGWGGRAGGGQIENGRGRKPGDADEE